MKRLLALLVTVAFIALIVFGIVWKIVRVDECIEEGGIIVGGMTRGQDCGANEAP